MATPPILSYEGLGLNQGSDWLFRDMDLHIGPQDRLALIGRNGAGKTTMLRLINDEIESDKGRRTVIPGTNIVMLQRNMRLRPLPTRLILTWIAPQKRQVAAKDAAPQYAAHWLKNRICCCSTNLQTISTLRLLTGLKAGLSAIRALSLLYRMTGRFWRA